MKNTFLNLPIRNVAETDKFFSALGLEKNEKYSSEDTTNAKINENTFVMLLEDKRFATFVDGNPEPINNNLTIAIQFDTFTEVDDFYQKAIGAGAKDTTKLNLKHLCMEKHLEISTVTSGSCLRLQQKCQASLCSNTSKWIEFF